MAYWNSGAMDSDKTNTPTLHYSSTPRIPYTADGY
jgi:hypothetical protein